MTAGLRIEPLDWEHLEALRLLRNDRRVNRWLLSPAVPISSNAQDRFHREYLKGERGHVFVALFDGRFAGYGHVQDVDLQGRSAQVGQSVAPSEQGRGFGEALLGHMLDFCFVTLGLERVWLRVLAGNERALRLYEKNGFREEGVLRRAVLKDGTFRDVVVMGMLREEHGCSS